MVSTRPSRSPIFAREPALDSSSPCTARARWSRSSRPNGPSTWRAAVRRTRAVAKQHIEAILTVGLQLLGSRVVSENSFPCSGRAVVAPALQRLLTAVVCSTMWAMPSLMAASTRKLDLFAGPHPLHNATDAPRYPERSGRRRSRMPTAITSLAAVDCHSRPPSGPERAVRRTSPLADSAACPTVGLRYLPSSTVSLENSREMNLNPA
jgi:hypothetical protein